MECYFIHMEIGILVSNKQFISNRSSLFIGRLYKFEKIDCVYLIIVVVKVSWLKTRTIYTNSKCPGLSLYALEYRYPRC